MLVDCGLQGALRNAGHSTNIALPCARCSNYAFTGTYKNFSEAFFLSPGRSLSSEKVSSFVRCLSGKAGCDEIRRALASLARRSCTVGCSSRVGASERARGGREGAL